MEPSQPTPAIPTAPPSSLAGRLVNVFAAPGDVFDEIKTSRSSTMNWLAPAILLIVTSWLSAWLIFSQPAIRQQVGDMANKAIDKQVQKGKLTVAQADQARPGAEKITQASFTVGAVVVPVFAAFALPFWWGMILWLAGTKAMKGNFPFMKAVEASGLANMILVLDVVAKTLLIMVTGNLFASPGLTLLVNDFDPQNTVHSMLALVNVTLIWVLIIRSIGLARLSGAAFGKAAVWIFGIWATYTFALIGLGAALRAAFGG